MRWLIAWRCQSSISRVLFAAAAYVCVECQVVELPALRLTFVHPVTKAALFEHMHLGLPAGNDGMSVSEANLLGAEVDLSQSQRVTIAQSGEAISKC